MTIENNHTFDYIKFKSNYLKKINVVEIFLLSLYVEIYVIWLLIESCYYLWGMFLIIENYLFDY